MKRLTLYTICLLQALATGSSAQIISRSAGFQTTKDQLTILNSKLRAFTIVEVDIKAIERKRSQGKDLTVSMTLPGGTAWLLRISENELRAPNYTVLNNGKSMSARLDRCSTYKGHVNDDLSSSVRLSVYDGILEAYISSGERMQILKPIRSVIPDYPRKDVYILFQLEDVIVNPNIPECGFGGLGQIQKALSEPLEGAARVTTTCRVLEIATDADHEYYQANSSSVGNTNAAILSTLNAVEAVYSSTYNITFLVGFQNVWSSSSDPYTTPSSSETILTEASNHWEPNFPYIERDVVYLFSGKSGMDAKGRAKSSSGEICGNLSNSYAYTAVAVTNELVITTAHELGHLFAATHPDGSSASCTPTRTTMCTDPSNLGRVLQFAAASQTEMNTWINNHTACLTSVENADLTWGPVCSASQLSVSSLPANSSITTWTSTYTLGLTVNSSGYATRQNSYSGMVNVTVAGNWGNGGCTFSTTEGVWVGTPMPYKITAINGSMDGYEVCGEQYVTFVLDANYPNPSVLSYDWFVTNASLISNGGESALVYTPAAGQGINFHVEATNVCGTGHLYQSFDTESVIDGNYCFVEFMFTSYPNPAEESLSIQLNAPVDPAEGKYEAALFNHLGLPVARVPIGQKQTLIDIAHLKAGIYYLAIHENGRKVHQQRIVVE